MKFSFEENILTVNKNDMSFEDKISQVMVHKEKVLIVRLVAPYETFKTAQNIFGVSDEGKIIWRIHQSEPLDKKCPYISTALFADGTLKAYSRCGMLYTLDPETGKILKSMFVK